MKKVIFAIFAHPDDEAFGPSGVLLMEAKAGNDVHLVMLTRGDAGNNPDGHENLGEIREQEWRAAGELIGAKTMTSFGYRDGHLDNIAMIEIQEKLMKLVKDTVKRTEKEILKQVQDDRGVVQDDNSGVQIDKNFAIEFMSTDTNGLSGHIDHIVAGRATSFVFYKMKEDDARITRLRLACIGVDVMPEPAADWLFRDAGHPMNEIGEVIDARQYRDDIIKIMRTHHTQRDDCEGHIERRGDQIGLNYFLVRE